MHLVQSRLLTMVKVLLFPCFYLMWSDSENSSTSKRNKPCVWLLTFGTVLEYKLHQIHKCFWDFVVISSRKKNLKIKNLNFVMMLHLVRWAYEPDHTWRFTSPVSVLSSAAFVQRQWCAEDPLLLQQPAGVRRTVIQSRLFQSMSHFFSAIESTVVTELQLRTKSALCSLWGRIQHLPSDPRSCLNWRS